MTVPAPRKHLTATSAINDYGEALLPALGPPPEGAAERSAAILASHLQQSETSTERDAPAA